MCSHLLLCLGFFISVFSSSLGLMDVGSSHFKVLHWMAIFYFFPKTNNQTATKKLFSSSLSLSVSFNCNRDRKTTSLGKQTLMNSLYDDETTWVALDWILNEYYFFSSIKTHSIYFQAFSFGIFILCYVLYRRLFPHLCFLHLSWGLLIGIVVVVAFLDNQ